MFRQNVFLFSPTYELGDPSMHGVDIDEDRVFKDFDEVVIHEKMADQKSAIKRYGKSKAPHVLLVFDDLIAHMPQNKQSLLIKLFFLCKALEDQSHFDHPIIQTHTKRGKAKLLAYDDIQLYSIQYHEL